MLHKLLQRIIFVVVPRFYFLDNTTVVAVLLYSPPRIPEIIIRISWKKILEEGNLNMKYLKLQRLLSIKYKAKY